MVDRRLRSLLLLICLAIISAAGGFTSYLQGSKVFPGPVGSDPWQERPNDPDYGKEWALFSHLPPQYGGSISASEAALGSGIHADLAWQRHLGDPKTLIAVLDSGIRWNDRDLLDQHYLNQAELPLPQEASRYDTNNDGRFSVSDYAGDRRVFDANNNGVIDPGDLIAIFSDGNDDDSNGYIDDIAGWDFFENDNDPADRVDFGHGTGEAKDSAGAINNGIGGAGVCGKCSVVALRLNDSFIVDAQAFAKATVYAADLGSSVIQQALGSINASNYVKAALNYAYDKGVTIIGTAADENSYHHNYPSTFDPVLYTNAIRHDGRDPNSSSTFLNFNNCSNFGARVDVSTAGYSCSSEATGKLSGATALSASYGKHLDRQVSPGQLVGLIKVSADDINLGETDTNSFRHSTFSGWDTMTGYGRTNANSMLRRIEAGLVPTEARITSPGWFDIMSVAQVKNSPVKVQLGSREAGELKVSLFLHRGVENKGSKGVMLRQQTVEAPFRDVFHQLQLADLERVQDQPVGLARNKLAYTLVLEVENDRGVRSEARRTFFVTDDETLVGGFPQSMGGSGESSGFFLDLNGDGKDEFIAGDGSGHLHAYLYDGSELSGFPKPIARSSFEVGNSAMKLGLNAYASITAPVAAGDISGNGSPEIVVATLEGHIAVVTGDGNFLPGFPIQLPEVDKRLSNQNQKLARGVLAAPAVADLNGDGYNEIIVPALDGKLYVFDHQGQSYPGFPVVVTAPSENGQEGAYSGDFARAGLAKLVSSPAIYDLNGDQVPDIILGSNHTSRAGGYLFAIDGRGALAPELMVPGFPTKLPLLRDKILPTIGTGIPTSPAIGDIDGDQIPEIIIHGFVGKTYAISLDGRIKRSFTAKLPRDHMIDDNAMLAGFGHPALGDITGDGIANPITPGVGRKMLVAMLLGGKKYAFSHLLGAWDGKSGSFVTGFPNKLDDMALGTSPILANLDQQPGAEVIAGSSGYFIRAWNKDGSLTDFPKFTGGWTYGTPALGDMDGDGRLELAATTREGFVFVWKTRGLVSEQTTRTYWPTFKGGPHRKGRTQ